MAIDTSNISFINYLWTKKNSDGTLTGIRLSKDNLPEYLADPIPILAGKNISITPTNAGIEISAAADGKVKTVNTISPDPNGNVTVPIPTAGTAASAVGTTASGGSATTWSKSDHVHNISLATGDNNGQVKIAGTNVSVKGLGSAAYTPSTAYATSGHTHSFNQITSRGEAFLDWGGKNFSGSYGPIDAAMVPELGANRLAFMPADAVTIEYSRDGGSTWTDYGPTDSQKIDLFNGRGSSFTIGKATSGEGNIATNKYQLRVNIYTSAGHVYTVLNKFVIYLSTSGTNNNWCTIRARKQSDYTAGNDTWTTFADKISVSGWSGYNVINTSGITTYGNTASRQYGHIQFIFGCDTGSTNNSYAGLNINKIFGFGGVGWTTPSTMAKTGHMYTYDSSQNVTFPAAITSGAINSYNVVPRTNNTYNLGSSSYKWANVYATTIYENGTSLANKYAGISAAANNGTITIKQTGISDQTFTVNQSGNTTITLVDTNTWRPLGTGASDACAGNDARLSNARTPTAHTHTSNDITDALTLIQGNNITLTQTANGLKISAADVVKLTGDQEVSGVKTFNAPTNSSGTEQATMKLKTANGGSITFGKEGNNSGSMIRLDQVDGTCRLRFRSSATAGAMVWEQPESGSAVYMDVSTVNFRNTSAVVFNNFKSAGYLYTDSNGNLKKGTMPTSAKNTSSGLIKPWYSTTGASTYNGGTSAPTAGTDTPNINAKSATSGRYYPIEMDKNGRAYVNVPWTDHNTTYDVGDGLLKSLNGTVFRVNTGYETNNKNYAVQYGTYNDKTGLYVNVPWTNTNSSHTHSAGVGLTGSGTAGISGENYTYKVNLVNETKSGLAAKYTESIGDSSKFYAVRLDSSGSLGVYVPWTSAHSQTAIITSSSTNKIDIQRSSASNYRLLIQSGTITGQGHSGSWTISLAESMPNSSYTVLLTRRHSNSTHAYVTSKSTSSFAIYGGSSDPTSSVAFDYVAICMV